MHMSLSRAVSDISGLYKCSIARMSWRELLSTLPATLSKHHFKSSLRTQVQCTRKLLLLLKSIPKCALEKKIQFFVHTCQKLEAWGIFKLFFCRFSIPFFGVVREDRGRHSRCGRRPRRRRGRGVPPAGPGTLGATCPGPQGQPTAAWPQPHTHQTLNFVTKQEDGGRRGQERRVPQEGCTYN